MQVTSANRIEQWHRRGVDGCDNVIITIACVVILLHQACCK